MNKQFTVLGAGGFIGARLVSHLKANGHVVYAPTRGDTQVFQRELGHVIYCIGMTADFRTRPFDTIDAHITVLAKVLERARFDSLLYLSSTRIYANKDVGNETSLLQVDSSDPSDLYNISKLAGESLCRSCGRSKVKVARLSNVVGEDHDSQNFLSQLIREALSGRIELQSDPASAKDYILLDDVVALLSRIAVEGKEWLYNVGSGINVSHRDIVARLAELTGCEVTTRPGAPRIDFPVIDVTRIWSEFGFSAAPVLESLPRLIAAYRNQPSR
ncbi:MAG TPA: SDR family oxidoreductase [Noviherbaspirillum sp.]|nr:SDR family oxidoreductase [Noviherbaspirillum sp.]